MEEDLRTGYNEYAAEHTVLFNLYESYVIAPLSTPLPYAIMFAEITTAYIEKKCIFVTDLLCFVVSME